MPKIAVYKYLVFFIVSYDLRERYHLHVVNTKGRKTLAAKIWLDPIEVFEKGERLREVSLHLWKRNRLAESGIELPQFFVGEILNWAAAAGGAINGVIMNYDEPPIAAPADIKFEAGGSGLQRFLE